MKVSRFVTGAAVAASLVIPRLQTAHAEGAHMSRSAAYFNDCAYQSAAWALAQQTAKFLQGMGSVSDADFQQGETRLSQRLKQIDGQYGSAHHYYARKAEAGITGALNTSSDALNYRDVGSMDSFYAKMKQAWNQLNGVYPDLKTFCPLGHPARTQLDVVLPGDEYGDGIAPLPLSAPWLSVSRSWQIQWNFYCYGKARGFRIEVRRVLGNPAMTMTATSTYFGPLVRVAVNNNAQHSYGTTRLPGTSGPIYLVVHSPCNASIKVLG